jgi:hypothetical protein
MGKFTALTIAGAVLFTLTAGAGSFEIQEKTQHTDKCPNECKTCTDAAKKALDYMAKQISDKGYLTAKAPITYVPADKHTASMMTTAIGALAFAANGSTTTSGDYKETVSKILDYMEKTIPEILKAKEVGSGGGPVYSAALANLFLIHLYDKEKNEKAKQLIPLVIKYVTDCVGEEVSVSTWYGRTPGEKAGNGKKDKTKIWIISGATALLNTCIISVGRAKQSGFEVVDKPFQVAKDYYNTYVVTEGKHAGSMKYDQHNHFPGEPRRGRSIASILAMMHLGIHNDEKFKIVHEYARKNYDRTGTHHTPSLHTTLCAFTFSALGKDDWRKFVEANFHKIIAHQKEDGSLDVLWDGKELSYQQPEQVMKPNDTGYGPNWATAHFALILQIALNNVKLFSSKA